jgi:hypothetical protein
MAFAFLFERGTLPDPRPSMSIDIEASNAIRASTETNPARHRAFVAFFLVDSALKIPDAVKWNACDATNARLRCILS